MFLCLSTCLSLCSVVIKGPKAAACPVHALLARLVCKSGWALAWVFKPLHCQPS